MPTESNDSTNILLQLLREDMRAMREDVADVRAITAEVKGELMQHEMTLQQVLKQQLETNGNVRRHDGEIRDIREGHIRDDGIAAGRKAERDRLYLIARIASKPATWAWTAAAAAVAYVAKDRAG